MTANDIFQIGLILITCFVIIFCYSRLVHMEYKLNFILINLVKYAWYGLVTRKWYSGYIAPWRWLMRNTRYIFLWMILAGHWFMLYGLLEQFKLDKVQHKMAIWFISPPLISLGFMGLILAYEKEFAARVAAVFKKR